MLFHVGVPIEHRLLGAIVISHRPRSHVRLHVFHPQLYFLGGYVTILQENARDPDQHPGYILVDHFRWSRPMRVPETVGVEADLLHLVEEEWVIAVLAKEGK